MWYFELEKLREYDLKGIPIWHNMVFQMSQEMVAPGKGDFMRWLEEKNYFFFVLKGLFIVSRRLQ